MLRTFGELALEGSALRRPKPLLLLTYLALEGPKSRRYLAELFFQGASDPRDSLSAALQHLHRGAAGTLSLDGQQVAARVACDAALFKSHVQSEQYKDALALYLGSFLMDVSPDAGELEEWLLETREHLASLARGAHLALGEQALRKNEIRAALQHAETAQLLPDAPPLEKPDATLLYRLLSRTQSTLLGRFKREIEALGMALPPPRRPHNLPTLLTSFIGRDAERLELSRVLSGSDGRLVTVHGPGGVGKTRLALQVAADGLHNPLFEDGVFFVPLDALTEPTQLLSALAGTVGAEPNETSLKRVLGERRILIVLDNLEHLLEAAPLLPELLQSCPNLAFLVTSRERLNLKAEWVLTLEGLALAEDVTDPERASLTEAVQLFILRAKRARVTFAPTAAELAAALRICKAVGGFPLGVELAAAWVGVTPLEALADTLEANTTALKTPLKDVRTRHRSMDAALDHSWRLLRPDQKELFMRLAVFQGTFTTEAAAQVADATPEMLKELFDKALLQLFGGRYGFHALLHAYAKAKLEGHPELAREAKERHGRFYSEMLGSLNLEASGGASPELLSFMNQEEGNLLAFLAWALDTEQYTRLSALAEPLLWHLPVQGRFGEAIALCERIVAALPADDPQARESRAAFLCSHGFLEFFAGDTEEAVRLAHESLATGPGSTLQELRALNVLGQAHMRLGETEVAVKHMQRALTLARDYGDPVRLLRSFANLGMALTNGDWFEEALRSLSEGLSLHRSGRVPKSMDVITLLTGFAYVWIMREEYETAAQTLEEALATAREIGSKGQQPMLLALGVMADLERALLNGDSHGDPRGLQKIEARCRDLLPLTAASGETLGHVLFLGTLARCRLEAGSPHEALSLLAEAHELAWRSGNVTGFFWILPHSLEAARALNEVEVGGTLAGFTSAFERVGSWVRRRSERTVARWTFAPEAPEIFAAAVARGRTLSLDEVVRRVLEFTGQTRITENL